MNENINLTKILKDCPKGVKFYSLLHGNVVFEAITDDVNYPVKIKKPNSSYFSFTEHGFYERGLKGGECLLLPSKDQRDWSKFTAPWYKPENKDTKMKKFDPKTLKPFNKVLVRDYCDEEWTCNIFSHIIRQDDTLSYMCIFTHYDHCIPYNDDTKHLIGTKDEAPEYYRYWQNDYGRRL